MSEEKNPRPVSASRETPSGFARSGAIAVVGDSGDIALDKSVLLDRAYEEYRRRVEGGEMVDPDEFCDQFSNFKSSLGRLLEAHRLFEENPELLATFSKEVVWPQENDLFLGFRLVRRLGRGGFAQVFLAKEAELGDRLVVVKIALHGGAEANVLGRLQHEGIVDVRSIKHEENSGLTAVCMPYLGQATLCDVLDAIRAAPAVPTGVDVFQRVIDYSARDVALGRGRPLPAALTAGTYAEAVLHLGVRIAEALAFVHDKGVCHRDLKPSNILLAADGRPMLLDFNLAAGEERDVARIGGTLPYMAPEQLAALTVPGAAAPTGAAADVFAFGVILYELLSGAHPFGPISLNTQVKDLPPLLLRRQRAGAPALHPHIDERVADLIARCLSFEAERRPRNGAELLKALRPLAPRGDLPAVSRRGWFWRHWRSVAAVTILIGAIAAASLLLGRRSDFDRGMEAFRLGEFQQAAEFLGRAAEADPGLTEARVVRAKAMQRLGQFAKAYEEFSKLPEPDQDGPIQACLGYCADKRGQHDMAMLHYEKALERGFAPAWLHNNLGYSRMRRDHLQGARNALDEALRLNDRLQAAYVNRARLDVARVRYDQKHVPRQGIDDIRRALEIGPLSGELYYDAAVVYAYVCKSDLKWTGPGIDAVREAVRFGADTDALKRDVVLNPLKADPGFAAALRTPPARPYEHALVLIDPLTEAD